MFALSSESTSLPDDLATRISPFASHHMRALTSLIGSLPLFSKMSNEYQAEVFPKLKPHAAAARESVVRKGDAPDR